MCIIYENHIYLCSMQHETNTPTFITIEVLKLRQILRTSLDRSTKLSDIIEEEIINNSILNTEVSRGSELPEIDRGITIKNTDGTNWKPNKNK